MSLNTKTVLVQLNISHCTFQKLDKRVSGQTNESHGAAKDAGRYNKHLLHKDALRKIQGIVNDARTYHYANTLDWNEATGTRILPIKKIPTYTAHMRKLRQDFDDAIDTFLVGYPTYIEYARGRLGDMFDITDFPPADTVKARFRFEHRISPVPHQGDFRVDIPQQQLSDVQFDLERRLQTATVHATRDLWNRASTALDSLYSTLSNPGSRVYRSTIHDNLVTVVEQIKDMNFSEDMRLKGIAMKIEASLFQLDAEAIKKDPAIREIALGKVNAIIRELPQEVHA